MTLSKEEIKKLDREMDKIFLALANSTRRVILLHIGDEGKVPADKILFPIHNRYPDLNIKIQNIRPYLSDLKNKYELVAKDDDNNYVLTKLGERAFELLKNEYIWKLEPGVMDVLKKRKSKERK
jgi:predicted transcriptional regulator